MMHTGAIMDYIFGFGTKFAVQILGLVAFGIVSIAPHAALAQANAKTSGANVNVSVSGLRNVKGQLMVCLTKNPKAFPDCSKDPSSIKKLVAANKAGSFTFQNVAPGTYAVAIVHDENSNNKMDLSLFIPKEGFAFSRNPTITVGPPKFKSAAFAVGSNEVSQAIKMKYMF
jgi:uncharacterized protein (DUF2141 family)